ncbi:hypothetical protein pdul_cds_514 [Pandoravirus dulcis]|uniref:DUF5848 domain-containing protein n=1 Tax=Pandoravirus dulcis TaxID=1349409 RepID=S4VX08_9VIRU|nr:hypothetical protein pdul_cds_514 [Pandoravirus dulcis]AGO82606.1 hypothetical protein pdul_cds_514 [Pandoravirus dulcis]
MADDSDGSTARSPALTLAASHLAECAARGGPTSSRDRAFLRALTEGANLAPPGAGWVQPALLVSLYVPFWTALQAIEDARPGTVARIPWPPTPFAVYLCAAEGFEGAARRHGSGARFSSPYGPERAYGLAAASWDALARAVAQDGGLDAHRYVVVVSRCGDRRDEAWKATLTTPTGTIVASLVARPDPDANEDLPKEGGPSAPVADVGGGHLSFSPFRRDHLPLGGSRDGVPDIDGAIDGAIDNNKARDAAQNPTRVCRRTDAHGDSKDGDRQSKDMQAMQRVPVARAAGMLFEFGASGGARHLGPAAAALEIIYGRRARRPWPSLVCALLYAAMGAVVADDEARCPLRLLPTAVDRAVARPDQESVGAALGTMLAARDL